MKLEHALVSFYAVNIHTGEVLAEQQSDQSMLPCSCMKLVTTGAALHLLGSEARFKTILEYDGNLTLRGGGDPTLGSDRVNGSLSWKKQLEAWADAVQAAGITSIEGTVLIDSTAWETASAVPTWAFEDVGNYYGAGASAFSFHENSYTLFFKPGSAVGEPAPIIRTEPPLPLEMFRNEVKTGPVGSGDRACIYGIETLPFQIVRGTVPAGVSEFSIRGALPDPSRFCAEALTAELRQRGILVGTKALSNTGPRKLLHTTTSPTIGEIITWTNKKSINLYAEHLLKQMGYKAYGEGSTKAGLKAVADFWRSQKIDLGGFYQADGSGLSRLNVLTAKQLVAILLKMKQSEFFPLFRESLPPIAGHENCQAKSGSATGIKAYAGYKGDVAFALIINHCFDREAVKKSVEAFLLRLKEESKVVR